VRWLKDKVVRALEVLGAIGHADLRGGYEPRHPAPAELPPGRIVVVRDGTVEKAACFLCPGGCGSKILLSMSQARKPRWQVRFDWLGRPTVTPSVRQLGRCGCHYWIRRGAVEWCRDSGHGARQGQA
jgi:hypothetical protein